MPIRRICATPSSRVAGSTPCGPMAARWRCPCPEKRRVLRGGGWNNQPDNARSAIRNRNTPDNRNNNTGFRLARTLHARASAFKEPDVGSGRVQGQGYKRKGSARLDRNCGGGRFSSVVG
ncbi:SUMF1/EgtB/PvdO family nonheme iron enzyme [Zoogloea sp.]|uniref:SUMF1/EgtB/PvdO family nonheme iron enzyme n=1 Tax=Zoogloea sp. TaxID=49181 RepID=UPI00345B8E5B